jgi:hypothetical protein
MKDVPCEYSPIVGMAAPYIVLGSVLVLPARGQGQPQDTVTLRCSPMGGVKFEHKLHVDRAGSQCETCHHPSRSEKPLKAPQEAWMDCHTRPPQPGMRTGLPGAFHNPTAQAGTCIDCHKQQDAAGKKAPLRCTECLSARTPSARPWAARDIPENRRSKD